MRGNDSDKGFTIIELIFATMFFSILLMFVIQAFIQINTTYTAGTSKKLVQDATRVLLDDIVRTIRTSKGPLLIYDEPGESPLTNMYVEDGGGSFHSDTTVLRFCSEHRRFGWNEYNTIDDATPLTSDGSDTWNNYRPNVITHEANRYTQPSGAEFPERIIAIKSDVPEASASSGYAICEDRFEFSYNGITTSSVSDDLRIHDLDIDLISGGGSDGRYTYKVSLVMATADVPGWMDYWRPFNDNPSDAWMRERSIFEEKGYNEILMDEDDGTGLKTPVCKIKGGSEFCAVVKMETVVSTRN